MAWPPSILKDVRVWDNRTILQFSNTQFDIDNLIPGTILVQHLKHTHNSGPTPQAHTHFYVLFSLILFISIIRTINIDLMFRSFRSLGASGPSTVSPNRGLYWYRCTCIWVRVWCLIDLVYQMCLKSFKKGHNSIFSLNEAMSNKKVGEQSEQWKV